MENKTYILIDWLESQKLMKKDWFNHEAICLFNHEDHIENSVYLILEKQIIDNEYILKKSEELALQLETTEEEECYVCAEWDEEYPFDGGMDTLDSVLNLKFTLEEWN